MNDHITVLIVDDDVQIARMLERSLTGEGYECRVAYNAMEALELCEQRHFGVVITDVRMPGKDGLALTRDIKMKYDSDVIVISSHVEREDYSFVIDSGASDFVEKPINLQELKIRIERVVRERKTLEQLKQHRENLENKVRERTTELTKANRQLNQEIEERKKTEDNLKTMVNAMAGREVRMIELKKVIEKLRVQLKGAGMKPVADDPLKEAGSDYT